MPVQSEGKDEAEPRCGGKLALALAAGGEVPHRGGAKGRPNTCKGMFSMECAQREVPRREGETDEEYGTRSETLLNSVITDLAIDL